MTVSDFAAQDAGLAYEAEPRGVQSQAEWD
jgi:hypothetical protein